MDRDTLRETISHMQTLPTLSVIRDRVAAIMENPQSSARDLSAVISLDPVLAARLLRVVDWRRSIFAERVPTVTKAVSALGFEALRRLVTAQDVLDGAAARPAPGTPFALQQFWLHSVATAVAARTLAAHVGYPEPEECYVLGLLHDIGKLVVHQLFPDRFYSILAEVNRVHNTVYFCEVESGAPSHAVFGRILGEQWALPPKVIEVVGLHHTPNLAESFPKLVAIVHVADVFARALGLGSGGDPYVPPPKPAGLSTLGLRSTEIEGVMIQIEHEFPRAAALLL